MKLRNKKTGEIGKILKQLSEDNQLEVITDNKLYVVKSLAELNEEWEDVPEEPKEYWYIEPNGVIARIDEWDCCTENDREVMRLIGNYFDTKEEAEKAVEKLKAWKRLKDNGFTFKNWTRNQTGTIDCFANWNENIPPSRHSYELQDDLDLLFGGEE